MTVKAHVGGEWVDATGGPTHARVGGLIVPVAGPVGPVELLTQWGADTFEEPGNGWGVSAGCTLERSNEVARTGEWSTKITTTTTGTSTLYVPNDGADGAWMVTPDDHGSIWTASCWVYATLADRPLDLYLRFMNIINGAWSLAYQHRLRLTEGNTSFAAVVGEWVELAISATLSFDFNPNIRAVDAVLWIDPLVVGDVYYLDDASVTREDVEIPPIPPPQPGLRLPGLMTDYVSTPDSAANSTGFQYDLRVQATVDLPVSGGQILMSKVIDGTTGIAWAFRMQANGGILLFYSSNGTTLSSRSISGFTIPRGAPFWYRASRDAQGDVWLGVSLDGVTWDELEQLSQIGTQQFDTTGPVAIGRGTSAASGPFKGIIHYAELRDARNGNVVHTFDAAAMAAAANGPQDTTMLDTGGPWTIHGSDWEWVT